MARSCRSECSIWYLDDGTLAGDPSTVREDFQRILEASESLGLEVNDLKCEIYLMTPTAMSNAGQEEILEPFRNLAPRIKVVRDEDLTLLGAPICESAIEGVLAEKLKDLELMMSRLEEIDSHEALFLLRHCFAIPKLTYFLRSAPCFKTPQMLESYDLEMKKGLEKILNVTLDEETWTQSSLPVAKGGLRIRRATDLALPAFLASVHGADSGVSKLLPPELTQEHEECPVVAEAATLWKERVVDSNVDENNNCQQPTVKTVQANWDTPIYERIYQDLLDKQSTPAERARLRAVATDQASAWLNATPMSSIGLKLDNNSVRIAVGLRLGTKLCEPHKCICGQLVDPWGRHGLSCKNAKGTNPRHAHANNLIKRALASTGTPLFWNHQA